MAEAPDVSDLANTLRLAADVLARKAEIAKQISDLRAEDAELNIVVAGWMERVDDMREQMRGLFKAMPSPETLADTTTARQVNRLVTDILEM